jgi:hypothetical protein
MNTYTVSVYAVSENSVVDTAGAYDVGVSVEWSDGEEWIGEVTLCPREDGELASWGSPANWISGELLRRCECSDDYEELLTAIERAARDAAASRGACHPDTGRISPRR